MAPFSQELEPPRNPVRFIGSAFGQFAHFIGDDGKATALLTSACRFDCGIKRKQISLIGDFFD
jgi:hypothetical protein